MTWAKFQVVTVPFPFSDSAKTKRRPALVLSVAPFNSETDHVVLAMITTKGDWKWDVSIRDLGKAGLSVACKVRMKIFTLDASLVEKAIGELGPEDRASVTASMSACLWGE